MLAQWAYHRIYAKPPLGKFAPLRAKLEMAVKLNTTINGSIACLMVGSALLLGGGGTINPETEFLLELVIAGLVATALMQGWNKSNRPIPPLAIALAIIVVIVPIAQLVPLPPAIWKALPGRQPEIAALSVIGRAQAWMPLTMTPTRSVQSLLAILAELAIFLLVSRLTIPERLQLVRLIAVVAFASTVLGVLQLSQAGGLSWFLYADAKPGWIAGFNSNRNSATDLFQIGVLATAITVVTWQRQRDTPDHRAIIATAVIAMLLFGAVLTGSRAGILIMPTTAIFAALILWPKQNNHTRKWRRWIFGAALLASIGGFALISSTPVEQAMGRFGDMHDRRPDIWQGTLRATATVWPYGSGIGSFAVMYDAAQSLEKMEALRDTRAHNDWLEWALEAGIPGVVTVVLAIVVVLFASIRSLRTKRNSGPDAENAKIVIFATGTLMILGLHGLVDYPMRNMALAALAAVSAGFIMPQNVHPQRKNMRHSRLKSQ